MNDKKLTPQESMELITSMIQNSKQRVAMPDLRISVMWAVVTILTAAITWVLITVTHNPWFNFVWFAIPAIGIPANIFLASKADRIKTAKTYVDYATDRLWQIVGYIAIGISIGCFIAQQCGYPQAWLAMLFYAFIIVGFGATITGVLLKENSYVFGGLFSVFSGAAVIICTLCRIQLLYSWVIPLYMLCFLLMFIVPAFVIAKKIKSREK
ncbi:hypothetical protein E5358_11465 [Palleniella muris]|uniref:Uncharacterized protein n=1 Tax=Palleniella muris TaxID=3038145 RepID=A0AC61QNA6_9BACT|nr:hypothetical protein [Palleniella muris]TGX80988.1 hypothetical protein E5358_11465 [Palleniella muris]